MSMSENISYFNAFQTSDQFSAAHRVFFTYNIWLLWVNFRSCKDVLLTLLNKTTAVPTARSKLVCVTRGLVLWAPSNCQGFLLLGA